MVEANAFHIFLLLGFSFFLLSSIFYHVGRFLWKRAREKWREGLKSNGRIVSETRSNGTAIQRIVPRFAHRQFIKHWFQFLDRTYSWRIRLYVGVHDILFYRIFDNKIWSIFFLRQCNYILQFGNLLFYYLLSFNILFSFFFFLSRILFIIYRKRLPILLEGNIHWCFSLCFVQFSICNFCLSMYIIDIENW